MDEKYRLVFRGEVLDGQHRAVVKRRLGESLTLKDGQLEKLFSGSSVVLKRGVDAKLAARYQALFKKAGARLRVFAEAAAAAESAEAAVPDSSAAAAPSAATSPTTQAEAPPAEAPAAPAETPTSTFTLVDPADLDRLVAEDAARVVEISAPDYALAELGARLGDPRTVEVLELPDIELTLAEPGVDLLEERPEVEPFVVVDASFELAEVGAVLGPAKEQAPPPAPDTSHLAVVEEA